MPDRFLSAGLFRSSLISPQKLAVTALSAKQPVSATATTRPVGAQPADAQPAIAIRRDPCEAHRGLLSARRACPSLPAIRPRLLRVGRIGRAAKLMILIRREFEPWRRNPRLADCARYVSTRTTLTRKGYTIANRRIARACRSDNINLSALPGPGRI
jgi:hypothetical protein